MIQPEHTFAANGNSPAFNWKGGAGSLAAWGTWGSGSIKLQFSPDDGVTWIDAKDGDGVLVTLTSNDVLNFQVGRGQLRAVLSGATAPALKVLIS